MKYMICKNILFITFSNETDFFFSQGNGFKCSYRGRIILFTINHSFLHSRVTSSISI